MDWTTVDDATLAEWSRCGHAQVEAAAKAEQARRGREWGLANTRPQDAVYEVSESGVWLRRVA